MSLFSFCFLDLFWFLGCRYKWERPRCLPWSFCLISWSTIAARSIHVVGTWLWTVRRHWIAPLWPCCCQCRWETLLAPRMGWHRQLFSLLEILFHAFVDKQFPKSIYWRESPFPIVCFWLPCQRSVDYIWVGFFLGSIFSSIYFLISVFMSVTYSVDF